MDGNKPQTRCAPMLLLQSIQIAFGRTPIGKTNQTVNETDGYCASWCFSFLFFLSFQIPFDNTNHRTKTEFDSGFLDASSNMNQTVAVKRFPVIDLTCLVSLWRRFNLS